MKTFLVRHGEDDGYSLTNLGREQAQGAAEKLKAEEDLGVVAVFSSRERRAINTAEIIAVELGVDEVCFNDILSPEFDDYNILEAIGQHLLDQPSACEHPPNKTGLDSLIAITHQPLIYKAMATSLKPIRLSKEIVNGGIYEHAPYTDAIQAL